MTPERWQRIERVFHAACELDGSRRDAYLAQTCADDPSLRDELELLLSSDEQAETFIAESPGGLAAELLANDKPGSAIGRTIGRYQLVDLLGSGGMGEVYLANDLKAGRKAAIKLLPARFTGDSDRLRRFQQEARTVVALNHPNIVTIYDVGEEDSTYFIASELIEGETLRARLCRGPIGLEEGLDIAVQVASALKAAHEAGVVHRDIKPENIMLRPDGYVKVLDFGIAKLAEPELPPSLQRDEALLLAATNFGAILGTVRYMSPEQAQGLGADGRADIWGLGVVLYEMVTGSTPFSGDTPAEIVAAIANAEVPPFSSEDAVPVELQQIIGKALRKDREERYQSVSEVLQALKALRRKLDVAAELALAPAWQQWLLRHRPLVATLAAAAVIAALSVFWVRWQSRPQAEMRAAATRQQSAELRSLAVLPFVNLSGDPANEYFSDGITEEILNAVAHIPDLRVAARTSAFAFKGKNRPIAEIARNLRVNTVLEGSVQRMGDRVRITAQLIDAKSGYHLWSKRFDRDARDVFAVQDEIAQSIARALKLELTSGGKELAQRSGTANIESHDAYLKAREAYASQESDRRHQALGFVDQAITLDPKFAAAYALKAEILSSLAFGTAEEATYARYVEMGEAAARRAVELNPELAEAYAALGEIARRRHEEDVAVEHLQRAATLKPGDPDIWQLLAVAVGRRDPAEGLRHLLKAKELGSTSKLLGRQIAYLLDALGKLDEAYATLRETHAAQPEFVPILVDLGRYELWVRGRPDRALEFFARAYRQSPTLVDHQVPISFYPALVYAISGHRPETATWLARESATAPDSAAVAATRLLVAAADNDRATLAKLADRPADGFKRPLGGARRVMSAGDAAFLAGDFAAAAAHYRDAVKLYAETKPTLRMRRLELKLAYALRRLGNEAEAQQLLQDTPDLFANAARYSLVIGTVDPSYGVFYTDGELYALRGEKQRSLDALNATLALPDDGLIPIGSLPVPIEDSPLLESLRGETGFEAFRQEVARRRAIMKSRVRAATEQLGLGDE